MTDYWTKSQVKLEQKLTVEAMDVLNVSATEESCSLMLDESERGRYGTEQTKVHFRKKCRT